MPTAQAIGSVSMHDVSSTMTAASRVRSTPTARVAPASTGIVRATSSSAMANLVNVFNPEMIVLGGIFTQEPDILLPAIEQTMR
jgi:hypothetical protein